jgi:hypothetical protein
MKIKPGENPHSTARACHRLTPNVFDSGQENTMRAPGFIP